MYTLRLRLPRPGPGWVYGFASVQENISDGSFVYACWEKLIETAFNVADLV